MQDDDHFGKEPSRRIYIRGLQKKVNRQACRKAAGIVDTETNGESIILVAAEVDPRVRRLAPQPITFDLNTGETFAKKSDLKDALHGTRYKPWVYTPDFMFELANGDTVFVEGKHSRWLRSNPAFAQVATAMEELGHRLVLVTETTFTRSDHRNLRILRALPNRSLEPATRELIETQLLRSVSFGEAQWSLGLTRAEVYAALFQGLLATDLSLAPFSDRTKLLRVDGDVSHLEVLPL
ncbi:hypothetical protein HLM50_10540 [Sulfitobacter sp. Ks41]|uniref:hypothetical protein n=1 Tax=Sulfitobacter sp. Ks41 TaxID=2731139 RepID=UPI0023E16C02|nr:hypothetical protein [Sulfitobacter sp. Ks41]MDF3361498.1 hypothetical protein [Sulfitobacter sp. Ks41]